jgi:UTP--glucose-1-phosphate uridylyltransferase
VRLARISHRHPPALFWALIPAAGRGTRLRPLTATVPKVLLPVGGRPMLEWALQEAVSAGAGAVAVIVAPDQQEVRRFLASPAAAALLAGVALEVVEQPEPAGIGDALIRCRPLTGDQPFGVIVPDNWFASRAPALAEVARTLFETGMNTIGLVEVGPEQEGLLGNVGGVELEHLGGDTYRILALADKAAGTFAIGASGPMLRGCARYALTPAFYEALEAGAETEREGEWDDVPAFQRLTRRPGLAGHRLGARLFDLGNEIGYRAANAYLAGGRPL